MQEKEKTPRNVEKSIGKKYGSLLPYSLFYKRFNHLGKIPFRITQLDYIRLSEDDYEGQGKFYAYIEDFDKWCYVKVFKYWVVSFRFVTLEEMTFIENEMLF